MEKMTPREAEYQALRSFLKLASDSKRQSAADFVRLAVEEELTERQRQLVEMYYLRQMTMQNIASELGITPASVCRTLKRARDRLERCLKYGGRNLGILLDD